MVSIISVSVDDKQRDWLQNNKGNKDCGASFLLRRAINTKMQEIREQMGIESGTKFAVYGRGDTIIFKRVELPTVKDFEKLAKFGRAFSTRKGIKETDVLKDD